MKIAIVMGSKNDKEFVKEAEKILEDFQIDFNSRVLSAHRTPKELIKFVEESNCKIFIAAAGGAAHIAGVVASHTTKPVIGIPIPTQINGGLDSLLSMVQMPKGVPVGVIGIGNAQNAALLAIQMLAIYDDSLSKKLQEHRKKMRDDVLGI